MKIGIKRTQEIDVKVLKLHAKCSDSCSISVIDSNGETIHEHDGYVPNWFPEDHYGDYIIFDIDIETGKILNWKPPTAPQLRAFCEGDENE